MQKAFYDFVQDFMLIGYNSWLRFHITRLAIVTIEEHLQNEKSG